jgi:DNA-binding winged helix-turn-helix (wHTH) protein
MSRKNKELYEFGEFRLDVTEHFLARVSGERVQISEKAFETLCVLVRNGGHLLNKNELLNQIWSDSFVEENNLD